MTFLKISTDAFGEMFGYEESDVILFFHPDTLNKEELKKEFFNTEQKNTTLERTEQVLNHYISFCTFLKDKGFIRVEPDKIIFNV